MRCPLCDSRKARRACPGTNQVICAVCCGTKRLTEIACPPDCAYLASAREHPAAVVRRQQERDAAVLLPTLDGLTERQHQIFVFLFETVIARHKPEGFARLVDDDLADAAGAVAATLETAARGVIYEHTAQSASAQRLATELKTRLAEIRQQGAKLQDREVAMVLRAIEKGAREARKLAEGGDTAYLALTRRLLQQNQAAKPPAAPEKPGSSLIIP